MNLVILLLDVALFAWLSWRLFKIQPTSLRVYYWPALSFKVLASLAVGWLYFFHYGFGDTLSYWQDAIQIAASLRSAPGETLAFFWDEAGHPDLLVSLQQQAPRSLFFSKICGVLALVTAGNYWMMATLLGFISFVAAWYLFRFIAESLPSMTIAAAIAFLFFPSVIFWSSGLIKESLGLAALYLLVMVGLKFVFGQRPGILEVLLVIVALWVGWNLKYYWIGIFLPVALPTLLTSMIRRWRPAVARYDAMLWILLFVLALVAATNIHPNFYASRFMEVIYQNNLEFTRLSDPPRIVQYFNLEPSIASLLMNAPAAWIAGLFRPFAWEAFNTLSLLAGLENLLLLVLVLLALPSLRRMFGTEQRMLILAALVFVFLLTTFLALSTPNFGTLSRYKIAAVPILVFLCLNPDTIVGRWLGRKKFG